MKNLLIVLGFLTGLFAIPFACILILANEGVFNIGKTLILGSIISVFCLVSSIHSTAKNN